MIEAIASRRAPSRRRAECGRWQSVDPVILGWLRHLVMTSEIRALCRELTDTSSVQLVVDDIFLSASVQTYPVTPVDHLV
jgi:hypothetical protein